MTNKLLGVTLGELTNTVAVVVVDKSVLDDTESFEAGEWALLALGTLVGRDDVTATDNFASVTVDKTIAIRLASGELSKVAFDELSDRDAFAVDKVSLLVQGEAVEN